MYGIRYFLYGTNGIQFSQVLAYGAYSWVIPMTAILAAFALLPLRQRLVVWIAAAVAIISYGIWLGTYLGYPPPDVYG